MTHFRTTAWLFPGQGSQAVGMVRDVAAVSAAARVALDTADATLGFPLSALIFNGPQPDLDDTLNAQPALLTASVALLHALREHAAAEGIGLPAPQLVVGHSLGEYSALVAADALDFADGLRLVRERGRLMKQAGAARPGGMAALIGADDATAEAVAAALPEVQVANFNSPGQVVLSGSAEGLAALPEVAKAHGVRKVIPLAVSIAAHSPLMASIVDEYRAVVEATPLRTPSTPVISNVTAQPLTEIADIRRDLVTQMTAPVRWVADVRALADAGVTSFVEIGPGTVLTGLVKRIIKDADARAIGTPDDIIAYLAATKDALDA